MSHGLQISGNYTWSHAIDSGSTWRNGGTSADGFAPGDNVSTDMTVPNLDRGKLRLRHPSTAYLQLRLGVAIPPEGSRSAGDGSGAMAVERNLVVPERRPLVPVPRGLLQTPDLNDTEQRLAIRLP